LKVGIVGASGYTGAELMRLLAAHPGVEVSLVTAQSYAGRRVGDLYPHLLPYADMVYRPFDPDQAWEEAEFFFVALPHGESMEAVAELRERGARVVDLSADYRFSRPETYEKWYGKPHSHPELLGEAVYGLPELFRGEVARAALVAGPGCYPTAALLALAPLLSRGLCWGEVVVDAKSGVSGAGRSLSLDTHFPQAEGSVKPYGVGVHRHTPEMEEVMGRLVGDGEVRVIFVPHLIPMSRGILATCYARTEGSIGLSELEELYRDFYRDCPFVVILPRGSYPQTKDVCGSNYCHLGLYADGEGRIICTAAIDNLVKGASGQAIQCLNLMMGWEETTGLLALGVFP
jgi:N-acetyl-gamma-glutamyl-phosphate reductase